MKTVAFHNLGCKVNAYEADAMLAALRQKGYEIVPFDTKADIYIVNTCTVTNIADRKSRQMLHRAKKINPDAIVVAAGCYVQSDKDTVEADEAVDLVIGNNKKKDLVSILEDYMAESGNKTKTVIDINHTDEYEEMRLTGTQEHTRAYIKIQDGCNQFCTYCIIPYARGRVRCRRQEDILEEIKGLAQKGYQEFVLTGIHISSYGSGSLIELMRKIDRINGVKRIRLGSLEPRIITPDLAKALSGIEHICPHFHLSLQSGCETVLNRMNRHYTPQQYMEGVNILRSAFEHPAITTDVIVGFPGETDEEFETTAKFVREAGFYEMHIFKYSKRRGTKAAAMQDQVPEYIKDKRSKILQEIEKTSSKNFRDYYIGRETQVLLEEEKEINGAKYWVGHTKEYVKAAVEAADGENLSNRLINATATGYLDDEIIRLENNLLNF